MMAGSSSCSRKSMEQQSCTVESSPRFKRLIRLDGSSLPSLTRFALLNGSYS